MEGRVEQEARVDDGKIRVACDYLSPAIFLGSDRIFAYLDWLKISKSLRFVRFLFVPHRSDIDLTGTMERILEENATRTEK